MKSPLIIRLSIAIMLSTFVQSSMGQRADSNLELLVYTSPLTAVPFISNPQLTFGLEVITNEKWSISLEGGYKYMDTFERQSDTTFIESTGYSARIEYKAYENKILDGRMANDYFAVEYRYLSDSYNESYCYYDPTELEVGRSYEDHFSVYKQVHVLTGKYGFVIPFGRTFYIDPYVGLGIRYRLIENAERIDLAAHGYRLCDGSEFFANREWDSKSGIAPNVSLGFKFGIRF